MIFQKQKKKNQNQFSNQLENLKIIIPNKLMVNIYTIVNIIKIK